MKILRKQLLNHLIRK